MKPASRRTLWLLYALFILYGGTIPFQLATNPEAPVNRWHRLLDFKQDVSIPDIVQNVLLFAPFGALGMAAARDRSGWTWRRIAEVSLLGTALSCVVEGLQLFERGRVASPIDVVTNTGGAFAGAVATRWGGRLAAHGMRRLRKEGLADVAELRPLIASSIVLAIAFLQPFDVTIDVGTVVSHVRAFETNPWQWTVPRDEGMVILIASLFSMALASYLWALGEQGPGRKAALLGCVIVCGLESSQVVITSRMPGLWDAGVACAGILCGAGLWAVSRRVDSPGLWQGLLILMTMVAAGTLMLSPFEFVSEYRHFSWFPFLGYYTRTTFEALSHAIELALCYFPLGFCVALAAAHWRRALVIAVLVTLGIAAPIEYLQGWVVGRYPDVSDVGLSVLGAWIGVMTARTNL